MTPLAHAIVAQLTLPVKRRNIFDPAGLLKWMNDIHCFEVSAVFPAFHDMLSDDDARNQKTFEKMAERYAFLPAPRTWIEWGNMKDGGPVPGRTGVLLFADQPGSGEISAYIATSQPGEPILFVPATVNLSLRHSVSACQLTVLGGVQLTPGQMDCVTTTVAKAIVALGFINAPRIVGRRVHMPHAGLQRKLSAAMRLPGKHPLNAWTEIKLEITPPPVPDDPSIREVRLSGAKALHFCRSYMRVRLGRVEIVSWSWRGDAALGIRQSRYMLTPPHDGQPLALH